MYRTVLSLLCAAVLLSFLVPPAAQGKSRVLPHPPPRQLPHTHVLRPGELRHLGERLAQREEWTRDPHTREPGRVTQGELFALIRNWDALDDEFLALYRQATRIPAGMETYLSPGGHFVIHFSRTGSDAVDTTDRWGAGEGSWRERTPLPNGIPDYVDEVAWSLDSSWSAQAVRFGFAPYLPYGPQRRYRVVLRALPTYDYGLTWPLEPIGGGRPGFISLIEMRNNWDGWTNPPYEKNPQHGIRVTCAHEFFHAIQYSMAHQVQGGIYLDQFPVSWLEGTAVLMEELLFDDVDDYIQYTHDFFRNPAAISFLDAGTAWYYLNGLLLLYLNEALPDGHGVAFVRRVFAANYERPQPFFPLLRATADSVGANIDILLSSFFTESYFTGHRSADGVFLAEADKLPVWRDDADATTLPRFLTKPVNPYAMQHFVVTTTGALPDTLTLQFLGRRDGDSATGFDNRWGGDVLLRPRGRSTFDAATRTPVQVSARGNDTLHIGAGAGYDGVMLIAANLDPRVKGKVSVAFDTLVDEALYRLDSGPIDTTPVQPPFVAGAVYPNPVSRRAHAGATISWPFLREARIYDRRGTMVWHARGSDSDSDTATLTWDMRSASGGTVVPGTYLLVVGYQSGGTSYPPPALQFEKRTLFVTP